ncbi:ribonuclease H-like domain-containing protein [Tanacetum coccineum]
MGLNKPLELGFGASSESLLHQIIISLHQEFAMTDLGPLNYFLGISVTRNSSGLFLSQKKYAVEILDRAHMVNFNPSQNPIDTESKLGSDGDMVADPTLYRSFASSLQYLTFTRPDIFMQYSSYFLHLPHIWLLTPMQIGLVVLLLVARLPEAEYRGVANAVAETCWLRNLLRELHTPLSSAALIYCDSVIAVGLVRLLHVPSRYQYANIFTKGMPSALFEEFRFSLSVRCPPAPTAGEC